jgi:hypothetical protein
MEQRAMSKAKAKTTPKKKTAAPATKTTAFRAGTAKQSAFETFKAQHAKYDAMDHAARKAWREGLAKTLKLSPTTVASWCGGQFKAAIEGAKK